MAPSETALLKIDFATRNDMRRDSCVRQKEQSEDNDRIHLLRLVFVGRVLFIYLIEKLKMLLAGYFVQMTIVNLR